VRFTTGTLSSWYFPQVLTAKKIDSFSTGSPFESNLLGAISTHQHTYALSKWCGKGGAKVLLLDAQRRLVRQDLAGSFVPNEQRQLVAVVYSEIGAGRVPLSQPGGQSGF
jgi:hypothetical protein